MIYQFRNSSGDLIERDYPMSAAPPVGARVTVDGVPYFRVPSLFRTTANHRRTGAFASHSLPLNHPDAPALDSEGRACFKNKQEARDFGKRISENDEHGQYVYDD